MRTSEPLSALIDPFWHEREKWEWDWERLDPWDDFEKYKAKESTIDECLTDYKGWFQDFNTLAFHVNQFYGIPISEKILCRKRRGIKWISVRGYDYAICQRNFVYRRKSQ